MCRRKKIIYRMDREKEDIGWDGNLAVAVYVEAQDRLCMESPRMLSQFIERDWEMRIRDEIILTPGSHL